MSGTTKIETSDGYMITVERYGSPCRYTFTLCTPDENDIARTDSATYGVGYRRIENAMNDDRAVRRAARTI
jgi:hypothetical protein